MKKILIIDDNDDILSAIKTVLTRAGYGVSLQKDSTKIKQALKKNQTLSF